MASSEIYLKVLDKRLPMRQQSLLLLEYWSTIRMPTAIIKDIITMVIADTITITVRIITVMGINA